MTKTEVIKQHCKQLKLSAIANNLDDMLRNAQNNQVTYLDFVTTLMKQEVEHRMEKDKQRRTKQANGCSTIFGVSAKIASWKTLAPL